MMDSETDKRMTNEDDENEKHVPGNQIVLFTDLGILIWVFI